MVGEETALVAAATPGHLKGLLTGGAGLLQSIHDHKESQRIHTCFLRVFTRWWPSWHWDFVITVHL